MSLDFINVITEEIDFLKSLENYKIVVGIKPDHANDYLPVTFLDFNGEATEYDVSIRDILYFTEYGTLSLPSQSILSKIIEFISAKLNDFYELVCTKVFSDNFSKADFEKELLNFEKQINLDLPLAFKRFKNNELFLAELLNIKSIDTQYQLPDLTNYLHCWISKK